MQLERRVGDIAPQQVYAPREVLLVRRPGRLRVQPVCTAAAPAKTRPSR